MKKSVRAVSTDTVRTLFALRLLCLYFSAINEEVCDACQD
jgi:hypothetical protein